MSGLHKDYNVGVEIVLGARQEHVLKRFFLANYINGMANPHAYREYPESRMLTVTPLRVGEKLFWNNVYNSFVLNRTNYFEYCNYILAELKKGGVTEWDEALNQRVKQAILKEIRFWRCAKPDTIDAIHRSDNCQRLINEKGFAYAAAVLYCGGNMGIKNKTISEDDDNVIATRLALGFRNRDMLLDALTIPLYDVQQKQHLSTCARMFTRYMDEAFPYYDYVRQQLTNTVEQQVTRDFYNGPIRDALFVEWVEDERDTERMIAFKQVMFYAGADFHLVNYLQKVIDGSLLPEKFPAMLSFLPNSRASQAFHLTTNDIQVLQQVEKQVKETKAYSHVVEFGYEQPREAAVRYIEQESEQFGRVGGAFKTSGVSGFS